MQPDVDPTVLAAKLRLLGDMVEILKAKLPELSSSALKIKAEESRVSSMLQAMQEAQACPKH